MATSEDNFFPSRAGLLGRLRNAWAALFGHVGLSAAAGALPASDRAALLAAQPLIETLIGGLPDPAIVLDRAGGVVAFNEPAAALAPALRRGEPALIALRMPELVEAIRRATKRREPQRVEFFERVPLDRWFEAFVTPVSWRPAQIGGSDIVLMTFNDLTPLRRVEEMRADFVANASHELRTPLAALSGFIETLQGSGARRPGRARERFLGIMQAQATRMARLIDDLLSLSRIELNAHLQPGPSRSIWRRSCARWPTACRRWRATAASRSRSTVPAEPLMVLGDRDELIRVFENLVENALKYGAAGKRVDVALTRGPTPRRHDGSARVGARLRPRHRARAPAAADRALLSRRCRPKAAPRAAPGSGSRWSSTSSTATAAGCTIESTPGEGATFTVHLPLPTADLVSTAELRDKSSR